MCVVPDSNHHEEGGDLDLSLGTERRGDEIEHRTRGKNGEIECWKVVVQEKLTLHEEERHIVESPAQHEESSEVIVFDHSRYGMTMLVVTWHGFEATHCDGNPCTRA